MDQIAPRSNVPWHFVATGSGRPLILLHGIGMSHAAWTAVTARLGTARCAMAFDIAGFGLTPGLRDGIAPTIPHLVDGLEQSLHQLRIELPVDVAGNSLGGTMALEAARRGLARSVVAIAPACLWKSDGAPHVKHVFRALRFVAMRLPTIAEAVVRRPWLREVALAVPLSRGSRRMPVADAIRSLEDLANSPGFDATFEHTRAPFHAPEIAVPVTVAFGGRDWILPEASRQRSAVPPHARWVSKPDWGHVPLWVDPAGVAALILEGTR